MQGGEDFILQGDFANERGRDKSYLKLFWLWIWLFKCFQKMQVNIRTIFKTLM